MADDENIEEESTDASEEEAVEYLLDEEGNPVLDEEGNPVILVKKSKKKLIIIIVLLVLLIGGGAGAYFAGVIPGLGEDKSEQVDPDLVNQTKYIDLDEFMVNLNEPGTRVSFLKMKIVVTVPNKKTESEFNQKMPEVRDAFLIYLRELRSGDLKGSAGMIRLKEELRLRIDRIIDPYKIEDILFKEIVVQ